MTNETIFTIVVLSLCAFIILVTAIRSSREEKRRIEKERQEAQKRKLVEQRQQITEVVEDIFYNLKDFTELGKLSKETKENPYYMEKLVSMAEVSLNYYIYYLLHYDITYMYFAGIIIWISKCPELEKRFEPMIAGMNNIHIGCFDNSTSYHERIEEINRICGRKTDQITKCVSKLAEAIKSIPHFSTIEDLEKNLGERALEGLTSSFATGEKLNKILQILTNNFFEEEMSLIFIPTYMIYFATLKERTEEIMQAEKDVQFLYSIFFQPRTESDELKKQGILVRETKDLLIARSLIYMRSGLLDKVNEELNQYLYEIQNEDMIDDIRDEFLMLQKFYQEYGMKKQEEMILVAMLDRGMVLSSELEMRLQYLHKGINNTINIFNSTHDEDHFVYDYRTLAWGRQELTQYMDELTMTQQILSMPVVVGNWEKNINVSGVQWNMDSIKEDIEQLLERNFGNEYKCQKIKAGAVTEMGTEYEDSVLITENEGNHPWLAYLITGEQVTKQQVSIAIYAIFIPEKLKFTETKKEAINTEIMNWLISIKEKQNPKLNNKMQVIQTLLVEKLEECINRSSRDNIYA